MVVLPAREKVAVYRLADHVDLSANARLAADYILVAFQNLRLGRLRMLKAKQFATLGFPKNIR